jgi:TRAP-type C4-dicarboxylate transport system substrate-binding protein
MKTKKRIALVLALMLIFSLLSACGGTPAVSPSSNNSQPSAAPSDSGAAPSTVAAEPGKTYEWSLGTIYSDPTTNTTYNAFGEYIRKFCDLASEYSNGQVKINAFYDSVLGTSNDLYDQCKTNEIQCFVGQPMSTIDPRYGLTSIPGLFADYDQVEQLFTKPDSDFYKLMNGVIQEDNMDMIANSVSVFRVFYNSKKEIHVPSDLQGMTVRIYEDAICNTYWSGLCAASVIPYSEMFMSLQTGVVDGAEHTMSFGPSTGYQVCKYCSDINWQWTWGGATLVNQDALKSLPAELQDAVRKAATDAAAFYNTTWRDYNAQCADSMKELGMTYYALTDAERAEWINYGRSLEENFKSLVGEDFYKQGVAILDAAK